MSNWNDIASIYKLSIYISNGEKSTSIYANGNHQIPVDVIIEARNKENNPVFLSSDEIYDHINLVDYKKYAYSQQYINQVKSGWEICLSRSQANITRQSRQPLSFLFICS